LFSAKSQEIIVNANKQPLNEVFIELRNNYGIQFSFNDKLLASCIVTEKASFSSPEKAIRSLIKNCNLTYEIDNDVFIVYSKPKEEPKEIPKEIPKEKMYMFSGGIFDKLNAEALPFSSVKINATALLADVNGNFSFKSRDSVVNIKIAHVGYSSIDTNIYVGRNKKMELLPASVGLPELVVNSTALVNTSHIGEKPGLIKLNRRVASFLPGNNDNKIFTLLRLQPGVLAASEQANDYVIWGSYKGQTLILFDGMPLFAISGMNDRIGVVNPMIIKDVEVFKAGYNVDISDRVGGLVNITGKSGSYDKFSAKLNLNSQTLSGLFSVPFADKYSLQASFRKTYDWFYDWQSEFSENSNKAMDVYSADYKFSDLNLKFSGKTAGGDNFYFSFLSSNDFALSSYEKEIREDKELVEKEQVEKEYLQNNEVKFYTPKKVLREKELLVVGDVFFEQLTERKQTACSFFYNKNWDNIEITNATVAYSGLNSFLYDIYKYEDIKDNSKYEERTDTTLNSMSELSAKINHYFPAVNRHSLSMGGGITYNESAFASTKEDFLMENNREGLVKLGFYLKDNISLGDKINICPGVRLDFIANMPKPYIQPRIDASFKVAKGSKIHLAWGLYNQFISENIRFDNLQNYLYIWDISNNDDIPVLEGMHCIAGVSHKYKGFNFSVEGFYKTTNGLIRLPYSDSRKISWGYSKSYGADFYLKKKIKKQEFWLAYTLSKTQEFFGYFPEDEFRRSPHDQTHEVKGAAVFNLSPFFISVNYVYGSGLVGFNGLDKNTINPYSRLDAAFLYRFNTKKVKLETGLSVINVLNTQNVRYSNFSNVPNYKQIYSKAMPFTPTLFLNIGF